MMLDARQLTEARASVWASEASLQQTKAAVRAARAEYEFAENERQRAQRLFASKHVAKEQVDAAGTRETAARAALEHLGRLRAEVAAGGDSRRFAAGVSRLLRRLAQTLIPIGLYLLGVGTDWLLGMLANPERSRARAREWANLLVDLGAACIKAG